MHRSGPHRYILAQGEPLGETIVPRDVAAIDWETWSPDDRAVLCFIQNDDHVLLIHKKRGLGAGKINGPGGRIEPGETAVQAAIRETREEIGLTPREPRLAGELSFQFTNGYGLHCTVFTAEQYGGRLTETEEALPFWCGMDEIPFDRMWADDRMWIPLMLERRPFWGYFVFDDDLMVSCRLDT